MTIRVNFSGLITFVPTTLDPKVKKKSATVLLVDGYEPHFGLKRNKDDMYREILHPHVPVVTFKLGDLDPKSQRRPDVTAGGYGACFVSYEEITLGKQGTQEQLEFDYTELACSGDGKLKATASASSALLSPPFQPQGGRSPQALSAASATARKQARCGDLCWLLPLHHALDKPENKVRIAKKHLTAPLGKGRMVIARTQLKSGRLYHREFAHKEVRGEERVPYWQFMKDENGSCHHLQPLSSVVTYEPKYQKKLDITFTCGKWQIPPLKFSSQADRHVEINIWNAPFADLLSLLGGRGSHEFPEAGGYSSFRSYFRLLKDTKQDLPFIEPMKDVVTDFQLYEENRCKGVGCPCSLALAG